MTDAANEELPPLLDHYVITVMIPVEYEVQANTIGLAAVEARKILAAIRDKHPAAKLMRIMNDVTYVALEPMPPAEPGSGTKPPAPRGSPPSGTPGTPVVRVEENLNCVAKVA